MTLKAIFQKYPLHAILLIPFLSIFLYAHNVEFIAFFMLKRTLLWGTLFSIFLLIFFYFLFKKNIVKSSVFTSILLILFFNYGVIYDYLELLYYKGFWPFKNIHRYLTLFYLIIFSFLVIFFFKSQRKFFNLNYILNIIVLILLIWNSILLLINLQKLEFDEDNKSSYNLIDLQIGNKHIESQHLPDIYFIILDGYANQHILLNHYNFNNSEFLDFLRNKNFYVLDSCSSNYYSTLFSLASTLNIKYFSENELSSSQEIINQLRNNLVFNELKKNGYKIVQLKSGYSVTSFFNLTDSIIPIKAPNEFERAVLKYSMFRLDDIIGQMPYLRLKSQFDLLANWKIFNDKPTFNFIHVVCPHPPYIFNAKGERFYKSNFTDNSWEPKENYIEQLSFVNNQVEEFLNNILNQYKERNSEPIIILLSDHGPYLRSSNKDDVFEIRSKILYAIKTPGLNKVPDFKTSVNTFPYIFNNYFNYNINYLNDSLAGEENFKNSTHFKNLIN